MLAVCAGLASPGCAMRPRRSGLKAVAAPRPLVVVVVPVLNLSNSTDFDPLALTDMLATELVATGRYAVVPVNRVLAALARDGLSTIATPQQATMLGRRFGADAVLVSAVTDYDPYPPPRIVWTLQWYALTGRRADDGFDPVLTSRLASDGSAGGGPRAWAREGPIQVQRVIDASVPDELARIRVYDRHHRGGHESPYGWKVHTVRQQLFLRYSCWAAIRTMEIRQGRMAAALRRDGARP